MRHHVLQREKPLPIFALFVHLARNCFVLVFVWLCVVLFCPPAQTEPFSVVAGVFSCIFSSYFFTRRKNGSHFFWNPATHHVHRLARNTKTQRCTNCVSVFFYFVAWDFFLKCFCFFGWTVYYCLWLSPSFSFAVWWWFVVGPVCCLVCFRVFCICRTFADVLTVPAFSFQTNRMTNHLTWNIDWFGNWCFWFKCHWFPGTIRRLCPFDLEVVHSPEPPTFHFFRAVIEWRIGSFAFASAIDSSRQEQSYESSVFGWDFGLTLDETLRCWVTAPRCTSTVSSHGRPKQGSRKSLPLSMIWLVCNFSHP